MTSLMFSRSRGRMALKRSVTSARVLLRRQR
jgi:hypothetical protein